MRSVETLRKLRKRHLKPTGNDTNQILNGDFDTDAMRLRVKEGTCARRLNPSYVPQ